MAHRLGAWLTFITLTWVALLAIRAGDIYRASGIMVLVLLLSEILIGVSAVLTGIPIALATAHNALAAPLLLSMLSLRHKTRTTAARSHWT